MTPRLLAAAALVLLATGCTDGDDGRATDPTSPSTTSPSTTATVTPSATPTSTARPTVTRRPCRWDSTPSRHGSGFVVELNIMSGNPNPAWRLSASQAEELRALLLDSTAELDVDGPDDLGGYGIRADRATTRRFLGGLGLPDWVWVQGDGPVAEMLAGTGPCLASD